MPLPMNGSDGQYAALEPLPPPICPESFESCDWWLPQCVGMPESGSYDESCNFGFVDYGDGSGWTAPEHFMQFDAPDLYCELNGDVQNWMDMDKWIAKADEQRSRWADQQDEPDEESTDCSSSFNKKSPPANSSSDSLNTTVMMRNLPNGFTRSMLLDLIDSEGFLGLYDFAYLPVDFSSGLSLGYGFINLVSPSDANEFSKHFSGFTKWNVPSDAVCTVTWGEPYQGLSQHVERYRNSPVMHSSVPDEWKPILLVNGARVEFPAPTKRIKAPKVRNRLDAALKAGNNA